MKKTVEYIILVGRHTFGGADGIAKTGGVVALFAASFKFPALPWQASVALVILLLFYGTYGVWSDQKRVAVRLKAELEEIKDSTPSYELRVGEVKQFTAKLIINGYKTELAAVEQEVRAKQVRANASGLALFSALDNFSINLPTMMRAETAEEKLERLQKHVRKLEAYETKISHYYKVELDIRGTRYDENIEVWLSSSDIKSTVLRDDYPKKQLPKMPTSDSYGFLRPDIPMDIYRPSKLYLASGDGEDGAYSKISGLNAQRFLRLFEDDFYIQTEAKEVTLHVKVCSQKITPQEFDVTVQLENAPVEEL